MDRDRTALRRRRRGTIALVALPAVFLGYFFVYPLLSILVTGFFPDGGFDPAPFRDIAARPSLRNVAWFTIWQALASTVLTLVVAFPAAYVVARYDFRGKRLFRAFATIPFVLPTVVVASAFLALFGPSGSLGIRLDRTIWAILIAHVFYNFVVVIRTVGGLWEHLDPDLTNAARVLGAGRWTAFRKVTLPLLRPAIAAASSIVFLFTFTSFGVILILGGLRYATLEVEIYRQTVTYLNLPLAAALAFLQLIGVALVLRAYSRYQERQALELQLLPESAAVRRPRTRGERLLVGAVLGGSIAFLGAPLGALLVRSFRPGDGYGLDAYRALASDVAGGIEPVAAVGNSLAFAAAATVIALAVGMAAAAVVVYRKGRLARGFDALLMLPLGTSAVTIGFGFLVALDQPVDLRTTWILVPVAHALVALPFVVRVAVPVMRSVHGRLREAAAVLGASPRRAWREVDLPIVGRAFLVGAGFAFAVSLGEFGATAFVARPATTTLPVAIFRLLGRAGPVNFAAAMALSVILAVITAAAILAIDRARPAGLGDF